METELAGTTGRNTLKAGVQVPNTTCLGRQRRQSCFEPRASQLTPILICLSLFLAWAPLHAQTNRFAYVTNEGSNSVSVYSVDLSTGTLTPKSVAATGSIPASIVTDPAGRFAFVANDAETVGVPSISVYTIEPHTGALTEIPGSPFLTFTRPNGMAMHRKRQSNAPMNWTVLMLEWEGDE